MLLLRHTTKGSIQTTGWFRCRRLSRMDEGCLQRLRVEVAMTPTWLLLEIPLSRQIISAPGYSSIAGVNCCWCFASSQHLSIRCFLKLHITENCLFFYSGAVMLFVMSSRVRISYRHHDWPLTFRRVQRNNSAGACSLRPHLPALLPEHVCPAHTPLCRFVRRGMQ